jgi:hypothetical protein
VFVIRSGTGAVVAMFMSLVAILGGCLSTTTRSAMPTGTVAGHMYQVGGPAPGSPVAVRGVVMLTNVTTGTKYAADSNGKTGYRVQVPVGTYKVSGLSAQDLANGHEMTAFPASTSVIVRQGTTARDNLDASIP